FGLTLVNIRGSDAQNRILRVLLVSGDDFRLGEVLVKETLDVGFDSSIKSITSTLVVLHI
ncbi:hypothetical protein H5410_030778, partial [Solanum commersonii]